MFTVKGKIGSRTWEITWKDGVIEGDREIVAQFNAEAEVASGLRLSGQTDAKVNHLSDGYSVLQLAERIFDSMSIDGDLPEAPGEKLDDQTIL